MEFKLIIAMVKPQLTDRIIEAMKKQGVGGATIIPARGTGMHEAKTFFGLTLEEQTDILLFVVGAQAVDSLLELMYQTGNFGAAGTGFAFSLSIDKLKGLEEQTELFKRQS